MSKIELYLSHCKSTTWPQTALLFLSCCEPRSSGFMSLCMLSKEKIHLSPKSILILILKRFANPNKSNTNLGPSTFLPVGRDMWPGARDGSVGPEASASKAIPHKKIRNNDDKEKLYNPREGCRAMSHNSVNEMCSRLCMCCQISLWGMGQACGRCEARQEQTSSQLSTKTQWAYPKGSFPIVSSHI